jgi:hypothetical protein
MRIKQSTWGALALLLAGLGGAVQARASYITIALDQPFLTAAPGDELVFTGTIYNNQNAIVDLNAPDLNLIGSNLTPDGSLFFSGPLSIDPLGNTGDFALFSVVVSITYHDVPGPHSGTFAVLGGIEGPGGYDPTTQNLLGQVDFTVNVAPEPGTSLLALAGLALAAGLFRAQRLSN